MLRKSKTAKVVVSFIFMVIATYISASALRMLVEKTKVHDNILDYNGTIDFVMNTTVENQLVLLIVAFVSFVGLLTQLFKKPKSYDDASDFGIHGTARWGEFSEIINGVFLSKKNKYKPKKPFSALRVESGLILGKVPEQNQLLIMPKDTKIDNRNVLVAGSAGSGKGQAIALNNIINNVHETMIVTDPKGELYDYTHKIKKDQGYQVYQIDFIDFSEGMYNPLDYVYDDQDAQQIAKIIASNSAKDVKEDFFHVEAQRLLTACIIYCKSENPNASISDDVLNLFDKIQEDENFLPELIENMSPSHPAYMLMRSLKVSEGRTRSSILASFSQQVGIFTINKIAEMTRRSTFDFKEFQERKSILYVKLPMDNNPFVSLTATFFDQLISQFYKMARENHSHSILKIPTIFLLDEFANIGKIDKYGRVLSTCRGLGMSMMTIVQDFGQIEGLYGKETARTIISNHDVSIFLRTKDHETARYFSELSGDTTTRMTTDSRSEQGSFLSTNYSSSKSHQEQYVKRRLITEGELLTIDRDKSYVFISGFYPFEVEKAWQFNIYGDLLENYSKYRDKVRKFYKKKGLYVEEDFERKLPIEEETNDIIDSVVVRDDIQEDVIYTQIEGSLVSESELENDFDIDDLEDIINNPQYIQHQKNAEEALEQMEKEMFLSENMDKLLGIFSESEIENEIESDKERLSM